MKSNTDTSHSQQKPTKYHGITQNYWKDPVNEYKSQNWVGKRKN